MGSVVKSIGKVFKKIGKGLKKIAPVLLVAAAAYVGYGYATGWQGAGWPRITEWGKSLMNGVREGVSLSESAVQASQEFANPTYQNQMGLPEVSTSAVATPASFPPDVVGEVMPTGGPLEAFGGPGPMVTGGTNAGLLGETISPSGEYMAMGPTAGLLSGTPTDTVALVPEGIDNEFFMPEGVATGSSGGGGWGDQTLSPDAVSGVDGQTVPIEEISDMMSGTPTSPSGMSVDPFAFEDAKAAFRPGQLASGDGLWNTIKESIPTEMVGKAWGFYKNLWKNDPLVALYGTQKVLEMVLTFLDKSEEEESYQRRHVAGMPPRSMSDVMKTHQRATAAGLRHDKTGIWAQRPSSGMQGPVNPVRASAINRQPPGLLGRNPQRALV